MMHDGKLNTRITIYKTIIFIYFNYIRTTRDYYISRNTSYT